jgi:maleylacetate reductase
VTGDLNEFVAHFWPVRVVFGAGSTERIPAEVKRLGARRALVLCTPDQRDLARRVLGDLGDLGAGFHDGAVMHVPEASVTRAAQAARDADADLLVAVGGGSTIGLAKALALHHGMRFVALPTTYAGSEMTPIWGLTADGAKRTGRDPRVLPSTVLYDPHHLTSLPPEVTGPSGMNAIAHAVESMYAPDRNPITMLLAEESIRAMAQGLPVAVDSPGDLDARTRTLYAAWLAGTVLGMVSMGLHHKLCHVLGGRFNLPHAPMHAVLLPHVAAFNEVAAPAELGRVAAALGAPGPGGAGAALHALLRFTCTERSLAAIGMPAQGIYDAAEHALADAYANPRQASREDIARLLRAAFTGEMPA